MLDVDLALDVVGGYSFAEFDQKSQSKRRSLISAQKVPF